MASAQSLTSSLVPELMATVMRLSPSELREFEQRFAAWQRHDGEQADDETALIEACQARMSPADERRLKRLIAKSEQGALHAKELEEYRILIRRTEKLEATRLAALAQLARRWGKPVRAVMEIVGWETGDEGATRDPAVPAKSRPRSPVTAASTAGTPRPTLVRRSSVNTFARACADPEIRFPS